METIYGIIEGNRLKTFDINENIEITAGNDIVLNPSDFEILSGEIEVHGKKYMEIKLISPMVKAAYGGKSQVPPCQQLVLDQINGETHFVPIIIS